MNLDEHIQRVASRSQRFYQASQPGHALLLTSFPVETPPVPPLHAFDLERQAEEFIGYTLEAARPIWATKAGLDDDWIPAISPRFGIAEHTAWLGSQVLLQDDTCLPVPLLTGDAGLEAIRWGEDQPWFRYMQRGYRYLASRKDGTYVVANRGAMMPMDIANGLCGDRLFTDFYDRPDFLHALMAKLAEGIAWYYRHLSEWSDTVAGGQVLFLFGAWFPAGGIGHLSNDAAFLCSPRIYQRFGFPYEKTLVEQFNGCMVHVHNQQLHFVPHIARLPGLKLLEVSNDPKTAPVLENLAQVLPATGQANLLLPGTSEQVRAHLKDVQERNVIFNAVCEDRADAADLIEFVRAHSRPLN